MPRPIRRRGRRYQLRLSEDERSSVRQMAGELRGLLAHSDPSRDAGVGRLFPPAYPDDPLENLEYERAAASELLGGRLEAIDILERTAGETSLDEDELLAWLGVANDLRLVLGTRLGVTEEMTESDVGTDDDRRGSFATYQWLTWLVDGIVQELGEP